MAKKLTLAFIGNPNCGKTTLFNAYTGANVKVANWPGVTVERMEGAIEDHGKQIRVVDLPGTYSLTSYTMEEEVSRDFMLSDEVDVIVDVVDASSLERSLYLTLQLIELNKPMVVALNMMDIVEKRGIDLDIHRLSEVLGVPCIPVTARRRQGLKTLLHAALHQGEEGAVQNHPVLEVESERRKPYILLYDQDMEDKISKVEKMLPDSVKNRRWTAIKLLEGDAVYAKRYNLDLKGLVSGDEENRVINQKYDFIDRIIREVMLGKESTDAFTERIDAVVTRPVLGIIIFLAVMLCVFGLTFFIGDALQGYIETFMDWITAGTGSFLESVNAAPWLISLICDGIISGVGGILTFLPNITILFLALAFLEDSGYMARVAYIMNDIMGRLGLSGRAFIPMVLGFGCSVPAIMASRTLETEKDRRRVMLITPFMSCSAKLPIYLLFAGMFFPENPTIAVFAIYIFGIFVALLIAWLLHLADRSDSIVPLLIELPVYKWPSFHTVFIYVWDKVKDFLTKAGTTIFVASIVIWFLMNFSFAGQVDDVTASFAGEFGRLLVPVLAPAGLGFWQIAVALVAGITAKEVVVSSTAVLFGIANVTSFSGMGLLHSELLAIGFGPLNAWCMMVFCLLYVPCIATIATIRRESGSLAFTARAIITQLAVAWLFSFAFFQIGSLIL